MPAGGTQLPVSKPPGTTRPGRTPPGTAPPQVAAQEAAEAGLRLDWHAPFAVDLRLVLGAHRRGHGDPTFRVDAAGALWRTMLTPDGPVTLRMTAAMPTAGSGRAAGAGTLVHAVAWGPGARWALDRVPELLGARDDPAAFRPAHPVLQDLVRRYPGFRVGRTGRLLESLIPAVLEQKVVGLEAFRAWRLLLRWHGLPAPGPAPAGLRVFPPAAAWRSIPTWDWHRAGVEAVRARTIAHVALIAGRLEAVAGLPGPELDRLLQMLPGIGPWTSAEARQRACGDPDAVSVGDYNLPAAVGWTLAREVADDARMLELLAPYAGQRYRVTRLIELGGSHPPRRGPRMAVRDYRSI